MLKHCTRGDTKFRCQELWGLFQMAKGVLVMDGKCCLCKAKMNGEMEQWREANLREAPQAGWQRDRVQEDVSKYKMPILWLPWRKRLPSTTHLGALDHENVNLAQNLQQHPWKWSEGVHTPMMRKLHCLYNSTPCCMQNCENRTTLDTGRKVEAAKKAASEPEVQPLRGTILLRTYCENNLTAKRTVILQTLPRYDYFFMAKLLMSCSSSIDHEE